MASQDEGIFYEKAGTKPLSESVIEPFVTT